MSEMNSPLSPLTPIGELYKRLSEDFPESIVERTWSEEIYDNINGKRVLRRGSGTRKGYDTASLPKQALVDRLNEVVGIGRWRVECEVKTELTKLGKMQRDAIRAMCRLKIIIGGIAAETPFVTAEHTTFIQSDAEQGAVTMAFKRACSWLSLGRQVWLGEFDEEDLTAHIEMPAQTQQPRQVNNSAPQSAQPDNLAEAMIEKIYEMLPMLWADLADSAEQKAQALHFMLLGKLKLPETDKPTFRAFLRSLTQAQLGEIKHNLKKHIDDPALTIPVKTMTELSAECKWLGIK